MKKYLEASWREIALWLLCGIVVVTAHGAISAWLIMSQASDDDDSDSTAGAIVIELAPMLAAPTNEQMDVPPGPDQVQSEAAVAVQAEKIEEKTEKVEDPSPTENDVKITDASKSEVVLDSGAPKPLPEQPAPQENQVFQPVTTAVQLPRADDVATPVAPQQTVYEEDDSDRIPEWRKQVSNRIERNKRYPARARARGEHGTAYLEFKLDREGHVVDSRIVRSSGSAALDQETLELLHRADPFPKPPKASLKGATVHLAVPLHFKIR